MKKVIAAAVVLLAVAPQAAASAPDPSKLGRVQPCSTRVCTVATVTLGPGETATFRTRTRFAVRRQQNINGYINGGRRDALTGIEGIHCGAYFYGRGLVVRATMPECGARRTARMVFRVTNGRADRIRLRVTLADVEPRSSESDEPAAPEPTEYDQWGRPDTDPCYMVDPSLPPEKWCAGGEYVTTP